MKSPVMFFGIVPEDIIEELGVEGGEAGSEIVFMEVHKLALTGAVVAFDVGVVLGVFGVDMEVGGAQALEVGGEVFRKLTAIVCLRAGWGKGTPAGTFA